GWNVDLGSGFGISAKSMQLRVSSEIGKTLETSLEIRELAIGVDTKKSDGFLAKLLPGDGLSAKGDVLVTWSTDHGLRFEGGAGVEIVIPLNTALGPITISRLGLGVFLSSTPIVAAQAKLDIGAELGP